MEPRAGDQPDGIAQTRAFFTFAVDWIERSSPSENAPKDDVPPAIPLSWDEVRGLLPKGYFAIPDALMPVRSALASDRLTQRIAFLDISR